MDNGLDRRAQQVETSRPRRLGGFPPVCASTGCCWALYVSRGRLPVWVTGYMMVLGMMGMGVVRRPAAVQRRLGRRAGATLQPGRRQGGPGQLLLLVGVVWVSRRQEAVQRVDLGRLPAILLLQEAVVALNGEASEVNARADDPLVVVGVHAYRVSLQVEGVLTVLHLFKLIFMQIRISPDSGVDHVGESLPPSNLEPPVQGSLYGNTFGGMGPGCGNSRDKRIQFISFLFEFLDEGFDGPFAESLTLPSLPVTHEAVHDGEAGVG